MDASASRDFRPRPVLAPWVEFYRRILVTQPPGQRILVTSSLGALIVLPLAGRIVLQRGSEDRELSDAVLIGPSAVRFCLKAYPGARYLLSALARGAVPVLLGRRADSLADRVVGLDRPGSPAPELGAIVPAARFLSSGLPVTEREEAEALAATAMLDQCLANLARLAPAPSEEDYAIARALWECDHALKLAEIGQERGWSLRRMEGASLRILGQTPKTVRRVARADALRARLLDEADTESLAALAADLGFSDQSHAIKELTWHTGFSMEALKEKFPGKFAGWLYVRAAGLPASSPAEARPGIADDAQRRIPRPSSSGSSARPRG